ncbi:DUF4834 family protein [Zunongwangia sp.]|uniref:DUF4834 family protein n=1 Tax=Zunongwangia sp. TaxID=1965325 RepID=UPI003AA92EBE
MYQADFSGIIRTLLIVLLVYFGLKIFFKYFGPILLKYAMKKMGKKFQSQFNQQFNSQQANTYASEKEKEGKVSIDKCPQKNRKSNKEVGEYIDYEEID